MTISQTDTANAWVSATAEGKEGTSLVPHSTSETEQMADQAGIDEDRTMGVTENRLARTILIYPHKGWQAIPFRELWEFRDLLLIFALRDIQIRYKQAALGALWALIQPIVQVVVFTLFFGTMLGVADRIAPVNGKAVPFAVFTMAGTVFWNFFASSVQSSSQSLIANTNILRKIYIPKLLIPTSTLGATLMDFAIALALMGGTMFAYGIPVTWNLLLLPLWLSVAIMAALGVGYLISALGVIYRDFKYVVPFLVQTWFFITPVIFPKNIVPEGYKHLAWLMDLNPMSGVITAFRASVLGAPLTNEIWTSFAISTASAAVVFIVGLFYFLRIERRLADLA